MQIVSWQFAWNGNNLQEMTNNVFWDDDDVDGLVFYIPFNIIFISRWWKGENEKLCNETPVMSWIPPPVGFEPGTSWSSQEH